jgi:hypothetical protein
VEGVSAVARFAAADDAAPALRRDGAVALDALWSAEQIDRLRATVAAQHPELADKSSLKDFQDTGTGRFIAPVTITGTVLDSGVLTHPALERLFAGALSNDWVFEAFGLLMTEAGAPAQERHRDAPELFPETPLARVLPPFALTVVIPLVDVGAENGPTAIMVGSQRFDAAACQGEPAVPEVPRGSALVWSFSTIHWGMANTTRADRPALYLTVCRPFWSDPVNFAGAARSRLVAERSLAPALGPRWQRARIA